MGCRLVLGLALTETSSSTNGIYPLSISYAGQLLKIAAARESAVGEVPLARRDSGNWLSMERGTPACFAAGAATWGIARSVGALKTTQVPDSGDVQD